MEAVTSRILGTSDAEPWRRALDAFPERDVYFLPAYHRAYELNGDGEAKAFVAEAGGHTLFYPFFIKPIKQVLDEANEGGWSDLETVYGYSGPLCTTNDPALLESLWAGFYAWCREHRVVAEFIRFNPLLATQRFMDAPGAVSLDRETVVVHLEGTEQALWERYPSGQRTKVRKAQAAGLVCQEISIADSAAIFRPVYAETMKRLTARDYYFFSDAYFEHLHRSMPEQIRYFAVREQEKVVAAALFLVDGKAIHYHLGGSDDAHREARPNNLLFHTVALWGRERGFKWLHLGGGRTPSPDDALLAFKATISKDRVPFHIGRRVHNTEQYRSLCDSWLRQTGATERPKHFLLYRLPKAS